MKEALGEPKKGKGGGKNILNIHQIRKAKQSLKYKPAFAIIKVKCK